jgi:nitrate reductase gamma subunit
MRYDRDQYTWKSDSSQLLRKKGMLVGSNLFHIGIILLFFGHFVGLLTPEWVYHPFMSAGTKQVMAMIAGGMYCTGTLQICTNRVNGKIINKLIPNTKCNLNTQASATIKSAAPVLNVAICCAQFATGIAI